MWKDYVHNYDERNGRGWDNIKLTLMVSSCQGFVIRISKKRLIDEWLKLKERVEIKGRKSPIKEEKALN